MKKRQGRNSIKGNVGLYKENPKKTILTIILSSLLFFIIAIVIFSFMFAFAYLFQEKFIAVLFRIVIIGIGVVLYYLLITEFIKKYSKKVGE